MRKGRNGEKKMGKKQGGGIMIVITGEIVATMSLPVNRLMATNCNNTARAKIFVPQTFWVKISGQRKFSLKSFGSKYILGLKQFWIEKILGLKIFESIQVLGSN